MITNIADKKYLFEVPLPLDEKHDLVDLPADDEDIDPLDVSYICVSHMCDIQYNDNALYYHLHCGVFDYSIISHTSDAIEIEVTLTPDTKGRKL